MGTCFSWQRAIRDIFYYVRIKQHVKQIVLVFISDAGFSLFSLTPAHYLFLISSLFYLSAASLLDSVLCFQLSFVHYVVIK